MSEKNTGFLVNASESAMKNLLRFFGLPKVRVVSGYLLRAILGFVISQAVIFEEYSPFGIGFAAASGSGLGGMFGGLGVIIGYSALWRMADSLKYAAGTVLTCAALYIFRNLPFTSGKFFAPIAAAASTAFVGFVFVAERGFRFTDLVLFITEIILVFSTAYFFREALSPSEPSGSRKSGERDAALIKAVSFFVLIATILIALSNVRLIAEISAGKLVAVLFVMFAALRGGFGMGCAAGVSMGIAFDVAGGGGFYSMAYGFSGLVAGIAGKNRKLPTAAVFVLTHAVVALVKSTGGVNITSLYETFAGSVLFMILPDRIMPDMRFLYDARGRNPMHADKMSALLKRRISGASKAFRDLHEAVKSAIDQTATKNVQDISRVFDRAAEKVCRSCALKGLCWERDCLNTYNVMNDLTAALTKKGQIAAEDFPPYFLTRCLKPDALIAAINSEMKSFLYLRRYRSRINLNRGIVLGQYSELASILKGVADEVTSGIQEDMEASDHIERLLHDVHDPSVLVWSNSTNGRICVDIEARSLAPIRDRIDAFRADLEKVLRKRMSEPEVTSDISGDRITIRECEPYSARIGVAAHKRKNSSMSGDCGTYFKTDNGVLYVILSDGMGSGREAAIESGSVVRLLEKFIRAGVETESALRTVNSALMLRNIDEGGFATLDLLELNLFTGEGRLFKCGAAPSFLRSGKRIRAVSGKVFPPGTGILPTTPDVAKLSLEGGEVLVMLSDGAYFEDDDAWMKQELAEYESGTPKELALRLAGTAANKNMERDDATVVIIEINRTR